MVSKLFNVVEQIYVNVTKHNVIMHLLHLPAAVLPSFVNSHAKL